MKNRTQLTNLSLTFAPPLLCAFASKNFSGVLHKIDSLWYNIETMPEKTFYSEGLRFTCTRCSSCCRGTPGYVFLSKNDLVLLVSELKMEYNDFIDTYCRWVRGVMGNFRLSLIEKSNYDCIFWDNGCVVYPARPIQCSSFPFWYSNIVSQDAWNESARSCPGMGKGTLHSAEVIEDWLRQQLSQSIITKT